MIHPRVSPTQDRALWALYRAGTLTTLNQWEYVGNDGRVRGQTMNGLHHRRLADVTRLPDLQVQAGERVFHAAMQWHAELTRAGQEWIAGEFVRIEGLPSPNDPSTV